MLVRGDYDCSQSQSQNRKEGGREGRAFIGAARLVTLMEQKVMDQRPDRYLVDVD
jgi:hypothetical protein